MREVLPPKFKEGWEVQVWSGECWVTIFSGDDGEDETKAWMRKYWLKINRGSTLRVVQCLHQTPTVTV